MGSLFHAAGGLASAEEQHRPFAAAFSHAAALLQRAPVTALQQRSAVGFPVQVLNIKRRREPSGAHEEEFEIEQQQRALKEAPGARRPRGRMLEQQNTSNSSSSSKTAAAAKQLRHQLERSCCCLKRTQEAFPPPVCSSLSLISNLPHYTPRWPHL